MGQYIVAIFSHMDGDNRTFLTSADNDSDAAKDAILAHCIEEYRNKDYRDWVAQLGNDFETIALGAAQGELILSTPFELQSLNTLAHAKTKSK